MIRPRSAISAVVVSAALAIVAVRAVRHDAWLDAADAASVRTSIALASPDAVGMSAERLARVHREMQRFVDDHRVAGVVTLIERRGQVVQLDAIGMEDIDAKRPMTPDTLFFIASMTKPITTVAVMMLYEEGKFLLSDRVSKFIPAFAHPNLLSGAAKREITIHDLLTHRSGLAYGFLDDGPVGRAYRADGILDGLGRTNETMADNVARLAREPLLFEPGSKWNYGLSTDVLGRIVELASGMTLAEFCRTRMFEPLGMRDTFFYVPDDKASHVAVLYTADGQGGLRPLKTGDKVGNNVVRDIGTRRGSKQYFSGGAGLISTAPDYARFVQMLLNGGELDGVRLLGPKTVDLMTVSHTGDLSPSPLGTAAGFGLGFRVVTDLGQSESPASVGTYSWGGIWGTSFWADPKEKLAGVLMIQRFPMTDLPIAEAFQALTYQAVVK